MKVSEINQCSRPCCCTLLLIIWSTRCRRNFLDRLVEQRRQRTESARNTPWFRDALPSDEDILSSDSDESDRNSTGNILPLRRPFSMSLPKAAGVNLTGLVNQAGNASSTARHSRRRRRDQRHDHSPSDRPARRTCRSNREEPQQAQIICELDSLAYSHGELYKEQGKKLQGDAEKVSARGPAPQAECRGEMDGGGARRPNAHEAAWGSTQVLREGSSSSAQVSSGRFTGLRWRDEDPQVEQQEQAPQLRVSERCVSKDSQFTTAHLEIASSALELAEMGECRQTAVVAGVQAGVPASSPSTGTFLICRKGEQQESKIPTPPTVQQDREGKMQRTGAFDQWPCSPSRAQPLTASNHATSVGVAGRVPAYILRRSHFFL